MNNLYLASYFINILDIVLLYMKVGIQTYQQQLH